MIVNSVVASLMKCNHVTLFEISAVLHGSVFTKNNCVMFVGVEFLFH